MNSVQCIVCENCVQGVQCFVCEQCVQCSVVWAKQCAKLASVEVYFGTFGSLAFPNHTILLAGMHGITTSEERNRLLPEISFKMHEN